MRDRLVLLVTTSVELSDATRELASRLAQRANAVLQFLHVIPFDPATEGEGALHGILEDRAGVTEAWHTALRPSDGTVRYQHRLVVGSPVAEIRTFVDGHDVQLLVVEEPPRSMISEALWRGLAERLIRLVDCPVVIGGPGFLRAEKRPKQVVYNPVGPATSADLLNSMVEARVDALKLWLEQSATMATKVAQLETVRNAASLIGRHRGLMEDRMEQRLRVELNEHQHACRAIGWRVTTEHRVWESHGFAFAQGAALTEFLGRMAEHGSAASLPMPLCSEPHRLVVLAGARISSGSGEESMLLLAFDASDDFLRILGQPGPLPSFESYAFDSTGLMLSNSRFPQDLVDTGLLGSDDIQTPLLIRVAEPAKGPPSSWKLTHMAAEATNQRDGFDTDGYLDYRGVSVMGAWRWLPDYNFGVAAEIDVS